MKNIMLLTGCLFAGTANAALVSIGSGDFSGSETVVDFSLPASNETIITNEYLPSDVAFSGSIYTMQNFGDINKFVNNGDGQIASNWLYGGGGLQGVTIVMDFLSTYTKIGFDRAMHTTNSLAVEGFNSGQSLGSLSFVGDTWGGSNFSDFVGVQDNSGIDSLTLTVSGSGNKFLSLDNLRFEGEVGVPEPVSIALLGLGLAGLGFSRKKKMA